MGNQADKKFSWVIKNFSSLGYEAVYSDVFVAGRCKWRLLAYPKGIDKNNLHCSLYVVVANTESLPSGWRRHAKFSFTLVNKNPEEASQLRETQHWFDGKNKVGGFPSMIRVYDLHRFMVNGEVKIVAEIDVLQVIGMLDVSLETTESVVDINGFQVLASQNPHLRTTYLNVLLSLFEILCKSPKKLSTGDLADAYSSLRYVTASGFELDWLEKKLKEAGETRIQEIEQELKHLTQKRADMEALLKFLK
ncbi:unnamed protein product [Microthlaspi erraticum]|uniref:MATH domain-containing protein n=1 Tax=Microthlaspi erraticum TaxID=1685480 RepID=A0A6D2JWN3_9BRAS|nr:unnamed protein product [Microthlaspi erraticum]